MASGQKALATRRQGECTGVGEWRVLARLASRKTLILAMRREKSFRKVIFVVEYMYLYTKHARETLDLVYPLNHHLALLDLTPY